MTRGVADANQQEHKYHTEYDGTVSSVLWIQKTVNDVKNEITHAPVLCCEPKPNVATCGWCYELYGWYTTTTNLWVLRARIAPSVCNH